MSRTRTWYSDTDVPLPDVSTAAKANHSAIWAFLSVLFGQTTGTHGPEGAAPSTANHTLDLSSNSLVAGAADHLHVVSGGFTDGDWVRAAAGSVHSWVAGHSNEGLYWCLDYATGSDQTINMYFSDTAFTGGSTTARPTATHEWLLVNANATSTIWSNNALAGKVHVCRDTNGGFNLLVSQNGQVPTPGCWIHAAKLDFTCAADTCPWFTTQHSGFGSTLLEIALAGNARNATNTAVVATGMGLPNFTFGTVAALSSLDADGNESTEPAPAYYSTVAGRKGYLCDCLWGPVLGARLEPVSGNAERALFNALWLPFSVYPTF